MWLCKVNHVWIRVTAGYCRRTARSCHIFLPVRVLLIQWLSEKLITLSPFQGLSTTLVILNVLLI